MLFIRQNLGSLEAAKAFNRKIYDYRCSVVGHPGCIGELACTGCYHVISDSICLCVGVFTCPKCGASNGTPLTYIPTTQSPIFLSNILTGVNRAEEGYQTGAGI